ncbi:MAG: DUF427 domain-containing protein [Pseudomonadota bacterium]
MTDIKIHPLSGTWTVRAAGAVIAETQNGLELIEPGHAPVVYFPRSDIAMAFLDQTAKTSTCPHKGDATYFSIETRNGPIENAGWSYDTPHDAVSEIAGHIAFYLHEKITIEEV